MPKTQFEDTPDSPSRNLQSCPTGTLTTFTGGECKAIYCGGAGNLVVTAADDSAPETFVVGAGALIPVRAKLVAAASTATGIVALF